MSVQQFIVFCSYFLSLAAAREQVDRWRDGGTDGMEDPYHSIRLKPDVWMSLEEYRRALEAKRFAEHRDTRRLTANDAVEKLLDRPEVQEALNELKSRQRPRL